MPHDGITFVRRPNIEGVRTAETATFISCNLVSRQVAPHGKVQPIHGNRPTAVLKMSKMTKVSKMPQQNHPTELVSVVTWLLHYVANRRSAEARSDRDKLGGGLLSTRRCCELKVSKVSKVPHRSIIDELKSGVTTMMSGGWRRGQIRSNIVQPSRERFPVVHLNTGGWHLPNSSPVTPFPETALLPTEQPSVRAGLFGTWPLTEINTHFPGFFRVDRVSVSTLDGSSGFFDTGGFRPTVAAAWANT